MKLFGLGMVLTALFLTISVSVFACPAHLAGGDTEKPAEKVNGTF